MPSNEDLYQELVDQERRDDALFQQKLGGDALKSVRPPVPDKKAATRRYESEIKPVLEARARVRAGQPLTRNPFKNFWLNITNQTNISPRPDLIVAEPSPGFTSVGPTAEEVRAQIAAKAKAKI